MIEFPPILDDPTADCRADGGADAATEPRAALAAELGGGEGILGRHLLRQLAATLAAQERASARETALFEALMALSADDPAGRATERRLALVMRHRAQLGRELRQILAELRLLRAAGERPPRDRDPVAAPPLVPCRAVVPRPHVVHPMAGEGGASASSVDRDALEHGDDGRPAGGTPSSETLEARIDRLLADPVPRQPADLPLADQLVGMLWGRTPVPGPSARAIERHLEGLRARGALPRPDQVTALASSAFAAAARSLPG